MATQGLNMGTRSTLLFGCAGPVNDVSFSDWLNAYLFVTDYGEIRAGYCHQLLVNFAEMHRKQRAVRQPKSKLYRRFLTAFIVCW